jgi:hypothetical protein
MRESYTRIFLKQLDWALTPANIKQYNQEWWINKRVKRTGGLRLSDEGYRVLIENIGITEYTVPFLDRVVLDPQTIIFLDRYLDSPYYLTNKSITVFVEKRYFELLVFADDIRKYGTVKSLNKDSSAESNNS